MLAVALTGLPGGDGHGPDFDRGEMGLRSPRFDSYRGFIFLCFDRETEPLREYLAGDAEYLDLVADQDAVGMRVVAGSNRYSIKANWKLLAENSIDGYDHPVRSRRLEHHPLRMHEGKQPSRTECVSLSGDMRCAVRNYAESVQGSLSSAYQNEVYVS